MWFRLSNGLKSKGILKCSYLRKNKKKTAECTEVQVEANLQTEEFHLRFSRRGIFRMGFDVLPLSADVDSYEKQYASKGSV